MNEKIKSLKKILGDLDTMIHIMEGGSRKTDMSSDGTVFGELNCYSDEGQVIQDVLNELFEQHGSEILPTRD